MLFLVLYPVGVQSNLEKVKFPSNFPYKLKPVFMLVSLVRKLGSDLFLLCTTYSPFHLQFLKDYWCFFCVSLHLFWKLGQTDWVGHVITPSSRFFFFSFLFLCQTWFVSDNPKTLVKFGKYFPFLSENLTLQTKSQSFYRYNLYSYEILKINKIFCREVTILLHSHTTFHQQRHRPSGGPVQSTCNIKPSHSNSDAEWALSFIQPSALVSFKVLNHFQDEDQTQRYSGCTHRTCSVCVCVYTNDIWWPPNADDPWIITD